MAALRYRDEHNKVGYLLKPTRIDDYHQIVDFLRASHIRYALTHDPIIFDSLVKQFWSTATLRSPELGPPAIQATIDKTPYTNTEDLVRSQLQLADGGGIDDLPIAEIYYGMDNLLYVTEGKLTFFKNKFSPQWRFLVHTILHCHSTKFGSWDQFGSLLALALICLSNGRQFNWSSYIFKGMVSNIGNAKKFLIQQTSDPTALVFEQGQSSDPNIASFSRTHETDDGPFTNVEDKPLGGSFHMSPPRGPDYTNCFVLCSFYSCTEDVDLDALLALANTAVTVDFNISPGGASANPTTSTSVPADVPTSANVPTGSTSVPADVLTSVAPAGVSNKGKSLMMEEDIPVKERTFKQMQEDILELQRRRQQEVLASAMYYTEADWIHIMAQVEANASLSNTLLGDDVSKDNFPARMAALIKRRKQALAEKLVVSNEDSDDEAPCLWYALVGWEVIPTPLADINALYRIDRSTSYFTTLREILHMVDIQDLLKLYGLVVKYYENHPVAGAGLIFWRLYTFSNVHVLETVFGEVVYMFADVPYPLSVKLMERMLTHKLEINKDVFDNDMTNAKQLIRFIKNQVAAAQVSLA
nr:synaptobrevin, longin-like domain protein [Tanacetum cinerariifolium]